MVLAMMVVSTCNKIEGQLPASIHALMIFNVILDFVIGLVPFVGDFADALYKCNTRNAVLLENFLKKRGEQNLQRRNKVNPHDNGSPDRTSDKGRSSEKRLQADIPTQDSPARPQPARIQEGNTESRGRFTGKRQLDLEAGSG